MIFSSIPFLYYFLPLSLLLYFLVPERYKNYILLGASLFFYAWGEQSYVFLMIGEILIAYIFSVFIDRYRDYKAGKILCSISVVITLSFLVYFKYANFFIENINYVMGLNTKLLNVVLPIGISFYTFQIISYTVDVYRIQGIRKNFIQFATYVTMFPQLIAGPIVRYKDILHQFNAGNCSINCTGEGIRRFVLGLAKKVLIANQLAELCEILKLSSDPSMISHWIYPISFGLFVYFDFSGYSDMAIGLGRILGFNFQENFRYPFVAKSITEFWRRWHISLGTWFRDYVYIPLGGNQKGKIRQFFNIGIVWMLTGLWHGAEWNFILWGLYFAVLLIAEKFVLGNILNKFPIFSHIYVIFFIIISFVLFSGESISEIWYNLSIMFGFKSVPFCTHETMYYVSSYATVLCVAVLGATPAVRLMATRINEKIRNMIEPIMLIVLFIIITAYLVDGSFNPFLYFRF